MKEAFYNIFKPLVISTPSFWCWLGFHKWKRKGGLNIFSSNVKEQYFICERCRKRKTVYIPKNNDIDTHEARDVSITKGNMKIHRWR